MNAGQVKAALEGRDPVVLYTEAGEYHEIGGVSKVSAEEHIFGTWIPASEDEPTGKDQYDLALIVDDGSGA